MTVSRRPRRLWTPDEVEQLGALAASGDNAYLIARKLDRSEPMVQERARKLGIAIISRTAWRKRMGR